MNKTKVKDVMIKNVITVSGYASLEDAAYLMYKNKVGFFQLLTTVNYMGSLLIVIFLQLFFMSQVMEKKEYALGSLLKIRQGVRKIIRLVADKDYNIVSTVQLATKSGKVVIEVQIDGKVDVEEVRTLFEGAGIQVDSLVPTVAKIFKTEISRFFSLAIILVF